MIIMNNFLTQGIELTKIDHFLMTMQLEPSFTCYEKTSTPAQDPTEGLYIQYPVPLHSKNVTAVIRQGNIF